MEFWIDSGKYRSGDFVEFNYLYGPEDRPFTKKIKGKLVYKFETLDSKHYLRVEDEKSGDLSGVFYLGRIVKNSFKGGNHD